jgi:uncharacterized membrane protein YccF (DUF307 family)
MSNNTYFENRDVYEKMWKNIVEPGRSQMILWHILIVWWIPTATNTQSECVTLIAIPLQQ